MSTAAKVFSRCEISLTDTHYGITRYMTEFELVPNNRTIFYHKLRKSVTKCTKMRKMTLRKSLKDEF